jgi:predicted CxxxxCH...CXXCH cytochrome family protein
MLGVNLRRLTALLGAAALAAGAAVLLRGGGAVHPAADGDDARCDRCHGGPESPAPPRGASGATDPRDVGVGAHQAHVRAGPIHGAVACHECHGDGRGGEPGHGQRGRARVAFGALASAAGAAPRWDRARATCSGVYCHGATLRGGAAAAPPWTGASGPRAACGSACHGAPPPPETGHPPSPGGRDGCARCHPDTMAAGGAIDVAGGRHLDGRVEIGGAACAACHRELDDDAPGAASAGARAGGAHRQHLRGDRLRRAIACGECHPMPSTLEHVDGRVQIAWGPLARARGAAPAWDAASGTCTNVYCHGATLGGGAGRPGPAWARSDGAAPCGSCHGLPPPRSTGHPPVEGGPPACGRCHPGVAADGAIDAAAGTHLDGAVELKPLSCTTCHGDPERQANAPAPPRGIHGETDTASLAVGAHQAHLRGGALARPGACDACHPVPTAIPHANGRVDVAFGALASRGGARPEWDRAAATCAGVYCHGATLLGGSRAAPRWTRVGEGEARCGACHGLPPPTGNHEVEGHLAASCGACHRGASDDAVDAALHADGAVDLGGGALRSYDAASRTCAAACHDARSWAAPALARPAAAQRP